MSRLDLLAKVSIACRNWAGYKRLAGTAAPGRFGGTFSFKDSFFTPLATSLSDSFSASASVSTAASSPDNISFGASSA